MAEEDGAANVSCPNCEQRVHEVQLRTCQMCRSLFCQQCAVVGYGREFCGSRCRDMFFFGDGDDSKEDF
jgi:hypothetical protein